MPTPARPNNTLAEIADALRRHQRFVIMSHIRPDGDAIGCAVALALSLRAMGKEVRVWNHDGALEKLAFLPGAELVTKPPAPEGGMAALPEGRGQSCLRDGKRRDVETTGRQDCPPPSGEAAADATAENISPPVDPEISSPADFEVAIALDTSTQERLGDALAAARGARLWINIDHHISNPGYGDLVHIDPLAPAAGQIIFELIRAAGFPLDRAIAENLWAAIATDTGSFQYSNTTARTFEIAAELVRAGVDVDQLSERLFQTQPRRHLALLRAVLNGMEFGCEGRMASFVLTREIAREAGAQPGDTEGLIDTLRGVEGVRVAVFFEETPHSTRVSMRSKDPRYDVSKLCAAFGGGGHMLASGARIVRLEDSQAPLSAGNETAGKPDKTSPLDTSAKNESPAGAAPAPPVTPTPIALVAAAVLQTVSDAIQHS